MRITLVCGLRGCGKSTYVKEHLTDGALAYDMDAIASAFRLRMPHEEYHEAARHMAMICCSAGWTTRDGMPMRCS